MPYIPDRVNFSRDDHELAKELNDVIEAIVDGEGSVAVEAVEAAIALVSQVRTQPRKEKYRRIFRALMANGIDEFEQRVNG